ncbi:MAG: antitoxin ParD1/3/4 [Candidatus Kentron sp. G]|nr:MAG: antitoxin ParD1/3/4 [Candidatus Kentron sp. G]VFN03527.1 MAG: antitoxin ParD1/3/4 [Candidatus Kentron sp. G]VFN04065.1 MAG: antitoxin ParD1/3/4 [Candidatus Kentron sp. G]
MNTLDRITITLTPEMANAVRTAVQDGEYASNSEIIREALRDWHYKRALQKQELQMLHAKVHQGLADVEVGRVHDFDPERIIEKGEQQLQPPEASA